MVVFVQGKIKTNFGRTQKNGTDTLKALTRMEAKRGKKEAKNRVWRILAEKMVKAIDVGAPDSDSSDVPPPVQSCQIRPNVPEPSKRDGNRRPNVVNPSKFWRSP